METKRINCDRCARGCAVTLTEEKGSYYLSGNNCSGGEQSAQVSWPFLKERGFTAVKKEEKKTGLLHRLFKR